MLNIFLYSIDDHFNDLNCFFYIDMIKKPYYDIWCLGIPYNFESIYLLCNMYLTILYIFLIIYQFCLIDFK